MRSGRPEAKRKKEDGLLIVQENSPWLVVYYGDWALPWGSFHLVYPHVFGMRSNMKLPIIPESQGASGVLI